MTETTTISLSRLDELENAELLLDCLRAYGVDNWIGWDDAMDDYHRILTEEQKD